MLDVYAAAVSLLQLVIFNGSKRSAGGPINSSTESGPFFDRVLSVVHRVVQVIAASRREYHSIATGQQLWRETDVHVTVHQAVDGEIETGMQVR